MNFNRLLGFAVALINCPSRMLRRLLLLIAISTCVSGCATTIVNRKPLQIVPLATAPATNSQAILIRFESTLPGKPLAETVWDNVTGAFADANEARQIGYTQNYRKMIPATLAAGALGGAIGGAVVAGTAGPQLIETRIVIPFGPLFEGVFQSGLKQSFPRAWTCADDSTELERARSLKPGNLVRLRVAEFQVWEKPLNHINLRATVVVKGHRGVEPHQELFAFETRHEIARQSIGSVMTTSSGFIKEMNRISNEFAGVISTEILADLQKRLGE